MEGLHDCLLVGTRRTVSSRQSAEGVVILRPARAGCRPRNRKPPTAVHRWQLPPELTGAASGRALRPMAGVAPIRCSRTPRATGSRGSIRPPVAWVTSLRCPPVNQIASGTPVASVTGDAWSRSGTVNWRGPGMEPPKSARIWLIGTGQFGPATERGVRRFQRRAGLPVTGIADAETPDWRGPRSLSCSLSGPSSERFRTEPRRLRRLAPPKNQLKKLSTALRGPRQALPPDDGTRVGQRPALPQQHRAQPGTATLAAPLRNVMKEGLPGAD
jgi:peptidoglycan hydrolase-like protein with peptidoglycan-binding domain